MRIGDRVIITGRYEHFPWVAGMHSLINQRAVIRTMSGLGASIYTVEDEVGGIWHIHKDDLKKEEIDIWENDDEITDGNVGESNSLGRREADTGDNPEGVERSEGKD